MVRLFTKKELEKTFTKKEIEMIFVSHHRRLQTIFDKNKDNYEVLLKLVFINGEVLQLFNDTLKNDKEIVLFAVSESYFYDLHREDGRCLKYASASLKKDRDVVNAAILSTPSAFEFVDNKFKKDKRFVLKVVREMGTALKFADDKFKKDREVVLAAVKSEGTALEFADDKFKKDKEVVYAAVKSSASALQFADKSFHNNLELLSGQKYIFELERRLKK